MAKPPKVPHDFKVGYRKPPQSHQFKPGLSGNPRGRPHGKPTIDDLFRREANKRIGAEIGGRQVEITKIEALIRSLMNAAIKGNMAAQRLILQYFARAQEIEADQSSAGNFQQVDEELDDERVRRMLRRFDHLRGNDDDE